MPITFKVDNTTFDGDYESLFAPEDMTEWIKSSKVMKEGCVLLQNTQPDGKVFRSRYQHGFVDACLKAYNLHCHLKISPDDIWLSITTALARYIDAHAEEMRYHFVMHEDKKELVVYGGGNIHTANYPALIDQLSTEIEKNTKDDVRKWIECNFSTSSKKTKIVSKLVLMGSMKNYFKYTMCLRCGLPCVTLEGNKEDWLEIQSRLARLKDWKLEQWHDCLQEVIEHFVNAFDHIQAQTHKNKIGGIESRTLQVEEVDQASLKDGLMSLLDGMMQIVSYLREWGNMVA